MSEISTPGAESVVPAVTPDAAPTVAPATSSDTTPATNPATTPAPSQVTGQSQAAESSTVGGDGGGGGGGNEPPRTSRAGASCVHFRTLANWVPVITNVDGREVRTPRGIAAEDITHVLFAATGRWPKCLKGDRLFVLDQCDQCNQCNPRGYRILDNTSALFAWIHRAFPHPGQHLPAVDWLTRQDCVKETVFFEVLKQAADRFDQVESIPHEPPVPEAYYIPHPRLEGDGDGSALAEFIEFFTLASDVDREIFRALLLSCVWGGPPGRRPMFVVNSTQNAPGRGRGVAKSNLAQKVGQLFGGAIAMGPKDDVARLRTRMLSKGSEGVRLVVMDNVKGDKLDWDELERLITEDVVSGHDLFRGEGVRANRFTYVLTCNGLTLSTDLAQRAVFLEIEKFKPDSTWESRFSTFLKARRFDVIRDLITILRKPTPKLEETVLPPRWAAWEGQVLAHVNDLDKVKNTIKDRMDASDGDADESQTLVEIIREYLRAVNCNPDTCLVHFASHQLAFFLSLEAGRTTDKYGRVIPLGKVGTNAAKRIIIKERRIPELTEGKFEHGGEKTNGMIWKGTEWSKEKQPTKKAFDHPDTPRKPEDGQHTYLRTEEPAEKPAEKPSDPLDLSNFTAPSGTDLELGE